MIHQNETCPGTVPAGPVGGINLWDVDDPEAAELLAMHAGDYTAPDGAEETVANTVHSMYAWNDTRNRKTYAVLVDNAEFTDIDIMDISDPRNPVMPTTASTSSSSSASTRTTLPV